MLSPCESRKLVDIVELVRIGLIGRGELAYRRISLLEVEIDKCRLTAKPETLTRWTLFDLHIHLPRGLIRELHDLAILSADLRCEAIMRPGNLVSYRHRPAMRTKAQP